MKKIIMVLTGSFVVLCQLVLDKREITKSAWVPMLTIPTGDFGNLFQNGIGWLCQRPYLVCGKSGQVTFTVRLYKRQSRWRIFR